MSTRSTTQVIRRPTTFSGVLTVIVATAGAAALFLETQEMALGLAGAGAGFLVLYLGLALRYRTLVGWVIAVGGLAAAAAGTAYSIGFATLELEVISLSLAFTGMLLATFAVAPLYGQGSRRLTMLAAFMIFGAGLVASDFVEPPQILAAAVAAALVWDFAENATGLGQQMGRQAGTKRAEFTHSFASTLVGVASASGGYAAYSMGRGLDWALEAVILMLVSIMLLVLFLYR